MGRIYDQIELVAKVKQIINNNNNSRAPRLHCPGLTKWLFNKWRKKAVTKNEPVESASNCVSGKRRLKQSKKGESEYA